MRRRIYLFIALAFVMAAIFSRLGFWQLARLHERQEYNRTFTRQLILQPVEFARLPLNPDSARFRGAVVAGTYDFDRELLVTPRTRRGSPGVEILTPLHRAGTDTVVLIDRGWVYSPDLGTVDLKRWREPDSAVVRGFVERYAPDTAVARSTNPRIIHRVSRAELASKLSDPVAPYYLIAIGDTAAPSYPARRDLPVLDEGSHMSYAVQWFTFATIALVGAGIVVQRERRVR